MFNQSISLANGHKNIDVGLTHEPLDNEAAC